jgi:hypothetical protein
VKENPKDIRKMKINCKINKEASILFLLPRTSLVLTINRMTIDRWID